MYLPQEAQRKPFSRQIVTAVEMLRVARTAQARGRDAWCGRMDANQQHLLPINTLFTQSYNLVSSQHIFCPPRRFYSKAFLRQVMNVETEEHLSYAIIYTTRHPSETLHSLAQAHSPNLPGQTTTAHSSTKHLRAPT